MNYISTPSASITARFLSLIPKKIQFECEFECETRGGNPAYSQDFNRYSYVNNNPMRFTDPSGYNYEASGHYPRKWLIPREKQKTEFKLFKYQAIDELLINFFSSFLAMELPGLEGGMGGGNESAGFGNAGNMFWLGGGDPPDPPDGKPVKPKFTLKIPAFNSKPKSPVFLNNSSEQGGVNFNNLSGQGGVTFDKAKLWYQFAFGTPMNVNLNTIDFSRVSLSDMNKETKLIEVQLDNPLKHMTNMNDALVYGTIYLQHVKGNVFRAAYVKEIQGCGDYYNFDVKWFSQNAWLFRNQNAIVGGLINGLMPIGTSFIYIGGTPYPIYLHGSVSIKP